MVCNAILIDTKVSPQTVAMARAKRLWRSGINGRNVGAPVGAKSLAIADRARIRNVFRALGRSYNKNYSTALSIASTTPLASPNTIMVLSM